MAAGDRPCEEFERLKAYIDVYGEWIRVTVYRPCVGWLSVDLDYEDYFKVFRVLREGRTYITRRQYEALLQLGLRYVGGV